MSDYVLLIGAIDVQDIWDKRDTTAIRLVKFPVRSSTMAICIYKEKPNCNDRGRDSNQFKFAQQSFISEENI